MYIILGIGLYLVSVVVMFCIAYRLAVLECKKIQADNAFAKMFNLYHPNALKIFLRSLVWPVFILLSLLEK